MTSDAAGWPALFCLLLLPPLALDPPRDLLVFFRHLGEAVPSQILRPGSMPLRRRLGIILARLLGIVLDRHLLPHEGCGARHAARTAPTPQSTPKLRCQCGTVNRYDRISLAFITRRGMPFLQIVSAQGAFR
jgi:hypothetical protein